MAPSRRRRWSCTSLGLRTRRLGSRSAAPLPALHVAVGMRAGCRTAPPVPPLALMVLGGGQLDDEAGAAGRPLFHRDGAAVALDDLAHDGQSDARAGRLGGQEELEDPLSH